MNLQEVSKRVASAVSEVNAVKERRKKITYDEFALEIKVIAQKYGLPVEHIRRVSGHEFTSIEKILKYHKQGRMEQFQERFDKLSETDKERVELALCELQE